MEYLDSYITYLKIDKNLREKTVEAYERDIKEFQESLGRINSIGSVKRTHISEFFCYLNSKNNSPITRRRKLTSLRNYFAFLKDEELIETNPAESVSMPRASQKEHSCLTEKEIRRILQEVKRDKTRFRERNYLMMKVLIETGIRINELTSMGIQDADVENMLLKIKRKGGDRQEIPINKELNLLLSKHVKARESKEPLFVSSYGKAITNRRVGLMFQKYVKKAGIKKHRVSAHTARHSFCSRLLDKGVNLKSIQILAGHKSISTTERYLHIAKKKLRQEAILAKIS